jgi:hypothetical protein
MSFGAFGRPEVAEIVERFSESNRLTLIVGAGASIEAALPSWEQLVRSLLQRAAAELLGPDETERDAWIDETLKRDGLLGAGAVVEAVSEGQLQAWLVEELYGAGGAAAYLPGPIALAAAELRLSLGDRVELVTSNYDDLLEEALRESGFPSSLVRSYIRQSTRRGAGVAGVTHLHGYAGRDTTKGTLVLSEEHYQRMQRGQSWQEIFMADRLLTSTCLFIGTSLADPNLIRYLYGYRGERHHAAVFVRQGESLELPSGVRQGREDATARRWGRCGVEAIFVDHFADVAQLLREIGARSATGSTYVPAHTRARAWITNVEQEVVGMDSDANFVVGQEFLSDRLRELLRRAMSAAESLDVDFSNEVLAASLWLASGDGTRITSWATTDRLHRDRATIEPVDVEAESRWVSVECFCRGARFEENRDVYASRWRFIRGLPLIMRLGGQSDVLVGCLTLTSNLPGGHSALVSMDEGIKAEFHRVIVGGIREFLEAA